MDSVLSVLSPENIQKNEYEEIIRDIRSQLQSLSDSRRFRQLLDKYADKPYYFKRNGNYLENKRCTPTIRDAACFYVLIKYLEYYKLKNNPDDLEKIFSNSSFDAGKYYMEFFGDDWDEEKQFIYSFICNEPDMNSNLLSDIEIDIVSGSVYKIKKYFLENSRIKDIRGGSALIKYVNEDVTFDYLRDNYTEECAVYCGGGNVLIIAPGGAGEKICSALEEKYTRITLTAQNAFEYVSTNLNTFIKHYKNIMGDLNQKLDARKKLKIYSINPDGRLETIEMGKEKISFDDVEEIKQRGTVCYLCGVRDGRYKIKMLDVETAMVCLSCLKKHKVGKDKTVFYDEYEEFTGFAVKKKIDSIIELEDENGHIAVIYADGNNMGNVVKNIETPFQHMYFSRALDRITKRCVYQSINEVMGNDAMFEAIALGGDDIFIIVPGNRSLEITNKIIEKFDGAFENKMTMSAGICIAKSSTPIRTLFEIAQYMLKSAKRYSRKNNSSEGTVDVQFIRSNVGVDLLESESSLFPAANSELSAYLDIIRRLKNDVNIKTAQLYKFSNAWRILKNPMEFQLFYLYQTGRLSFKYNDYAMEFLGNMKNVDKDAYCYCGLVKKKPGYAGYDSVKGNDYVSLWDDVILLMDAVGR